MSRTLVALLSAGTLCASTIGAFAQTPFPDSYAGGPRTPDNPARPVPGAYRHFGAHRAGYHRRVPSVVTSYAGGPRSPDNPSRPVPAAPYSYGYVSAAPDSSESLLSSYSYPGGPRTPDNPYRPVPGVSSFPGETGYSVPGVLAGPVTVLEAPFAVLGRL